MGNVTCELNQIKTSGFRRRSPAASEERIIAIDRCKISPGVSGRHRNCELGEIELSNRHPSCEPVGPYRTRSPDGNSSHSTVILRLACDRHSNDTTSQGASRHFFPFFKLPSRDRRMHERSLRAVTKYEINRASTSAEALGGKLRCVLD